MLTIRLSEDDTGNGGPGGAGPVCHQVSAGTSPPASACPPRRRAEQPNGPWDSSSWTGPVHEARVRIHADVRLKPEMQPIPLRRPPHLRLALPLGSATTTQRAIMAASTGSGPLCAPVRPRGASCASCILIPGLRRRAGLPDRSPCFQRDGLNLPQSKGLNGVSLTSTRLRHCFRQSPFDHGNGIS